VKYPRIWIAAHGGSEEVLLNCPDVPEPILRLLAQDKEECLRAGVLSRADVPEDLMRSLANDESVVVRAMAGRCRQMPQDVLRKLAADAEEDVRVAVAANPSAPTELLRSLVEQGDPSPGVLDTVVANPAAPDDIVRELGAQREEEEFRNKRWWMSDISKAPLDVLRRLRDTHVDPLIRVVAAQTIKDRRKKSRP